MKKIGIIMLIILSTVLGMHGVKAEPAWTNMANATYQFVHDGSEGVVPYFDLAILGAFDQSHTYEVYFAHSMEDAPELESGDFKKATATSSSLKVSSYNIDRALFEEAGDIYVWVRETIENDKKMIASAVKVARPEIMLSKRIQTNFLFEQTVLNVLYPSSNNYAGRSVSYKIGRVTDLSIVRAMNTTDEVALKTALNRLLAYAKADEGMYQGTLTTGTSESITKNMLDLKDDEYYYAYLVVDTENGKYYAIEDVNLYQGLNCELNPSLNNYTFPEFTWPDNYSCEIIDGIYYDHDGNVVDEETYNRECNPVEEKHVCEIVDGKYYGKDGVEVSEDVYHTECGEVTLPICEIIDGKYYGKDGNEIDKETYDKECGTDDPVENPDTGIYIGYGIAAVGVLIGVGAYLYFRKEGKFPQA